MAVSGSGRKRKSTGTSSTGRKSTGRRSTSRTGNKAAVKNTGNNGLTNEIVLIIVIAFSLLLFLSNLGVGGSVGEFISGILFGVFGIVSYLVPIAFILAAFAYTSGRTAAALLQVKIWSGVVLTVVFCSLAQLMFFPEDANPIENIGDYYTLSSGLKRGGGIIGGTASGLLKKGIGTVGTYIVLIVLALIAFILITEKSFLGGVRMGSRTLYDNARNDIIRHRERRENLRPIKEEQRRIRNEEKEIRRAEEEQIRMRKVEERNERLKQRDLERLEKKREAERIREENLRKREEGQLRMDRKVSGVMLDTGLKSPDTANEDINADSDETNRRDEIHEISYNSSDSQQDIRYDENTGGSDIRELSADYPGNEYRLSYENTRSSHTIAVDTKGMTRREYEGYDRKKLGDTSEFESAIINETLHLSNEYDYENSVTDVAIEPYISEDRSVKEKPVKERPVEEKPVEEYSYSGTTVDEYRMPSVTVSESSYDSQAGHAVSRPGAAKSTKAGHVKEFKFPPVNLLKKGAQKSSGDSKQVLDEKALRLKETLKEFGVGVTMTGYTQGPAITRFEMKPDVGVKVSKVLNLSDDIMLSMAAKNVRIEAPIPGKSLIGIELPNEENTAVMFRDLIDSNEFKNSESKLSFAVGKGLSGETVVADIGKMPHMLIAGATGSGKSVCINTLIMSILYKARPDEVKLIMVDPKVVELSVYNGIPHLMIPVVTDPKQAAEALKWGVVEMDDRYNKFAEFGVRDLNGYNKKVQSMKDVPEEDRYKVLPRIIIIVDELADLMMVASKEVEESICRIAQKARAAGIHLVIATQRPSVDVVTGLIKANMPSRIAFSVSSGVDSRTILDMTGAEKLLGKGDMLFYPQGYTKPARVQGAFVSDQEVNDVVDFLKEHSGSDGYDDDIAEKIKNASVNTQGSAEAGGGSLPGNGRDELFVEAAKAIIDKNKASIGMLQRLFKIGFNRAARIMDQLADAGVVGEEEGTKPRKVLMSMEQLENYIEEYL